MSHHDQSKALGLQIAALIARRNQAHGDEKAEIAARISALRGELAALR